MTAVDRTAPLRFLETAYRAEDWVAVFMKRYDTGQVTQRVGPVPVVADERFQGWLRWLNLMRWNVYVSVNAMAVNRRSRRRDAVAAVRHVFLEADQHGPGLLAGIAGRRDLPPPSYVLQSSPGRVHVFWRVSGFGIEEVERLQKRLAREQRSGRHAVHPDDEAAWILQSQAIAARPGHDRVSRIRRARIRRLTFQHRRSRGSPSRVVDRAVAVPIPITPSNRRTDISRRFRQRLRGSVASRRFARAADSFADSRGRTTRLSSHSATLTRGACRRGPNASSSTSCGGPASTAENRSGSCSRTVRPDAPTHREELRRGI